MKRKFSILALIACLSLLSICHAASAAEVYGTVDALTGSASVTGQDGQSAPVTVGLHIYEGDTITSAHDGEVHIVTEDGGIIALRPDTVFRVDQYKAEGGEEDKTFVSLLTGAMRSITGWIGKHNNAAYRVTTPTATIGVRGTDHEVTVIDKGDGDEPGTYDTVNEGATVMKTPHGEAEATPGKFAFAPRGRAAAPAIMAQHPRFWARRSLRMEGRIQQRKEGLRGRFEQMREERGRNFRQTRGEQPRSEAHAQQHPQERSQERSQARERRNESRGERAERVQRRRAEISGQRREKLQREGRKESEGQREHKKHVRRERD
jgi:hypothetical protein